jgi:hypothetical protein
MEIVFAILILIAAMAAGSNASTTDEIRTEKNLVAESKETGTAPRVEMRHGPCRFPAGRLIQRDLTVRRASTAVNSGVNSEEARHGCADQ